MNLLYLSLDEPLDPQTVATGNQVRVQGIRGALEATGHQVTQLSPATDQATSTIHEVYQTRDELSDQISHGQFDAILAGYWSLLAHLPQTELPVILDFIAPRLLELMFQDPENISEKTQELISQLHKADFFLVGNNRQADLLLPLLLQAEFDCSKRVPISVVPICARGKLDNPADLSFPLRFVNAGVDWPWRDGSAYRKELEQIASGNDSIEFIELTGAYPGSTDSAGNESPLLSYVGMQDKLKHCHIGIELGEQNTERQFSHSFRAMEYLECGLPIIINEWIPLADSIRKYDAGWVISNPSELETIANDILAQPTILQDKKAGVVKLKTQEFNYRKSTSSLLSFLESPVRSQHSASQLDIGTDASEVPELKEFVEENTNKKPSTIKIIFGSLLKIIFCPKRPESTPDILLVTRADLFPVDHGAAVKIIRTAEALSQQGRDVWLCTDKRREYYQFSAGKMITHRYPLWVSLICLPRIVALIHLLLKGYPLSNSFLYLPVTDISYIVRTVYLSSRKPIGAYQAEFPAYVRPCRYARSLFGGKILLVQHNVEYDRIRNQVSDLTDKNFHTLKNIEVAMCHLANKIVAVSENDRKKMVRDGISADKIHTIPHGVDLQAYQETPAIDIRATYGLPANDRVLVYHGTYSYPPNLEAMEVMAIEILPRLKQRGLSVSVLAIGSKPPDFPLHADIYFVGSVDDLAEVIPAADLAVVPLQDGGGTRMKILDYFAAGIPVVSTAKGIEGIPVKNGVEALVIDDYDSICDAIEKLLSNPDEARMLTEAASRFVSSLSWDAIVRQYLPLLQ